MRGGGAGCSEGGEVPGPGAPAGAPQMRGRAEGGGTPATPVAMATRPRPCISDTRKIVSKGHGFVGGGTPIPAGPALEGVPGSSAEASPRLDQGAGARGASTCTTATLWQPPRSGQHLGAQRPPRLLTRACPVQTARSARPRLLPAAARGFGASGLFANRLLCSRPLPWRRSPATACFEPAASCPRTGTWLEMCTVDSVGQCKWPRGVAWLSVGVAPRGHVELVWTGHSSLAGTDGL